MNQVQSHGGPQARYRITHPDPLNWAIEEWQAADGLVERGRYAGQQKMARWKAPEFFFPSLKHAAIKLLDLAAGDALLSGEAADILSAIKRAEASVQATLAVMDMGIGQPPALSQEAAKCTT